MIFQNLDPGDHANLVWIELSSKFVQKFHQVVQYRPQIELQTFEKHISTRLSKTSHYHGFGTNCLGRNVCIDRGIISGFHKKCNFYMCVAGQSP